MRMFQSAPPARGATGLIRIWLDGSLFQSAPPARGATGGMGQTLAQNKFQSAPPARGATFGHDHATAVVKFQSAPPARGATQRFCPLWGRRHVSIRAPRTGGDGSTGPRTCRTDRFNPRPPHGGRQSSRLDSASSSTFQSAPPARGATILEASRSTVSKVSIRAPRTGGDHQTTANAEFIDLFQSAPPARGATR